MKTRSGFVSNSSSSSFVLIGRKITVEEAKKLWKTSRVVVDSHIYGGEGYYIFELKTKAMMDLFEKMSNGGFNFQINNGEPYDIIYEPEYYEVFTGNINDDENFLEFNPSELPPIVCRAVYLRVDQHTPKNAKEMLNVIESQMIHGSENNNEDESNET